MVEAAIALPFMVLLLAAAFTLWLALNQGIGLLGAARSGSLSAGQILSLLQPAPTGSPPNYNVPMPAAPAPGACPDAGAFGLGPSPTYQKCAAQMAADAINADLNTGTAFNTSALCTSECVSITETRSSTRAVTHYQNFANITVTQVMTPAVPVVSSIRVTRTVQIEIPGTYS